MAGKLPGRSGRGRATRSRGYSPMAEINVTPFVDVMLVLLVIFMVTAPLLTAGIPLELPKSDAKTLNETANQPIEISIDKNRHIYIGEAEVTRSRLIPLLSAMTKGNLDRKIYIRGDQSLDYGVIIDVIGAVNGAGFTKATLISTQSE